MRTDRRGVFEQYERECALSAINPSVKLGTSIAVMLVATVLFDGVALLGIFGFGVVLAVLAGRCTPRMLVRGLLPFMLFGLGYVWMNALLPREVGTVLFRLGPLAVGQEGLFNGLRFAVRALSFGAWSLVFVVTTDPTDFARSLHQNLRISARFTYSALAAYRYLPTLRTELATIRAAHRLRGLGEGKGLRGVFVRFYRYTIPLLAGSLRRAGRVADSMDVRGLGNVPRSDYRRVPVRIRDWVYVALVMSVVTAIVVFASEGAGLERWSGRLW